MRDYFSFLMNRRTANDFLLKKTSLKFPSSGAPLKSSTKNLQSVSCGTFQFSSTQELVRLSISQNPIYQFRTLHSNNGKQVAFSRYGSSHYWQRFGQVRSTLPSLFYFHFRFRFFSNFSYKRCGFLLHHWKSSRLFHLVHSLCSSS